MKVLRVGIFLMVVPFYVESVYFKDRNAQRLMRSEPRADEGAGAELHAELSEDARPYYDLVWSHKGIEMLNLLQQTQNQNQSDEPFMGHPKEGEAVDSEQWKAIVEGGEEQSALRSGAFENISSSLDREIRAGSDKPPVSTCKYPSLSSFQTGISCKAFVHGAIHFLKNPKEKKDSDSEDDDWDLVTQASESVRSFIETRMFDTMGLQEDYDDHGTNSAPKSSEGDVATNSVPKIPEGDVVDLTAGLDLEEDASKVRYAKELKAGIDLEEDASFRERYAEELRDLHFEARVSLLRHIYALRHAWVALSGLAGEEAAHQQMLLRRLYVRIPKHNNTFAHEDGVDRHEMVMLAYDIHRTMAAPGLRSLLKASQDCLLPSRDVSKFSQRHRVHPAGPITKDSFIVLSGPDGSISEEHGLKMPLLTLGSGFGSCYKGRQVDMVDLPPKVDIVDMADNGLTREGDESEHTREQSKAVMGAENCELPTEDFFRNAMQMGYKSIDTSFEYGTQELIGSALKGSTHEDLFITARLLSPAWQQLLGPNDDSGKVEEQLRTLNRQQVDVLYNSDVPDSMNNQDKEEWVLLDKEVDNGNAKTIGSLDLRGALDHEDRVKNGTCKHHVSTFNHAISPCAPNVFDFEGYIEGKWLKNILPRIGNAAVVAHTTVQPCVGEPVMRSIARRLGRPLGQIAIRSVLERGIPVMAQSDNPVQVQDNLDALSFQISDADLSLIHMIPEIYKLQTTLPFEDGDDTEGVVEIEEIYNFGEERKEDHQERKEDHHE